MPRLLLHLEGLAILAASLLAYDMAGGRWTAFAILFLAPDLSMLGYLAGPRVGAFCYNAAHTYTLPLILACLGYTDIEFMSFPMISLIWFAHIGFDRSLGFGLKYPTAFKDTHMQRV